MSSSGEQRSASIDCLEFRRLVGADPTQRSRALESHESECASCRTFASRYRELEGRLAAAMRFDVASLERESVRRARSVRRWRVPSILPWAAAAVVVAAVAVGAALFSAVSSQSNGDRQRLVAEVIQHIYLEPASWEAGRAGVPAFSVEAVLARSGTAGVDPEPLGLITYVQDCIVNGRRVPHFAIQGLAGPVMLLLLPEERIGQPLPIEADGYLGIILPIGSGSVAIVGLADEPLEPVIARVRQSVSWQG